jgi:hypothetical protein
MSYLRKLVGLLTVMLLLGFTLPASADGDDETFSVTMTGPTSGAITAAFKNLARDDDDAIKSLTLKAPTGVTIPLTPLPTLLQSASGIVLTQTSVSVSADGSTVTVKNVRIGNQKTLTLQFTASQYPSSNACTGSSLTWTARAYEGSNASGDQFRLSGTPTTTVPPAPCTLSFATQPANTLSGAAITGAPFNNPANFPVTVQLKVNGSNAGSTFDSTPVSVTSTCTLANNSTLQTNPSGGVATFDKLYAVSGTNCTLRASTPNNIFAPVTSAPTFAITQPSGPPLACGASLTTGSTTDSNAPGYAAGKRGPNKGGDACAQSVNYSFSNGDNLVSLIWDTTANGQPNATFAYTKNWKAEDVDSSGWPRYRRPKVAWYVYDLQRSPSQTAGNPVFIPAQACTSQSLPAPYGTAAAIGAGASGSPGTITVTLNASVTLPPTPFAIVIDSERMLVTSVASAPTWNVVRGDGMTGAPSHLPAPVMSTPLPLLTSDAITAGAADAGLYYTAGKPAQMCVYDHGWIPQGFKPGVTPGVPQVVWTTSVFDIGDGFVGLDDQ